MSSVGDGCVNRPQDVGVVQHLLNVSGASRGVPRHALEVDGIVGPKTLAAIREFQTKFCKLVDGKVFPNNETIGKLNQAAGNLARLNDGVSFLQPKLNRPRNV